MLQLRPMAKNTLGFADHYWDAWVIPFSWSRWSDGARANVSWGRNTKASIAGHGAGTHILQRLMNVQDTSRPYLRNYQPRVFAHCQGFTRKFVEVSISLNSEICPDLTPYRASGKRRLKMALSLAIKAPGPPWYSSSMTWSKEWQSARQLSGLFITRTESPSASSRCWIWRRRASLIWSSGSGREQRLQSQSKPNASFRWARRWSDSE